MPNFVVERLLGVGHYSAVYDVSVPSGRRRRQHYALKRVFIHSDSTLTNIVRERNNFVRIECSTKKSPFLGSLLYCFRLSNSVVFVETLASGWTLDNFVKSTNGNIDLHDFLFYTCEVVSALEYLHNLKIVYLDLKPTNVLLQRTGHILISDLDSSFDQRKKNPSKADFAGSKCFIAPEI